MDDQKYVDFLKDKLKRHINVHGYIICMRNGAPCQRSKIVSQFLEEDSSTRLARQRPESQPYGQFMGAF